jgi:hypothetical protein
MKEQREILIKEEQLKRDYFWINYT